MAHKSGGRTPDLQHVAAAAHAPDLWAQPEDERSLMAGGPGESAAVAATRTSSDDGVLSRQLRAALSVSAPVRAALSPAAAAAPAGKGTPSPRGDDEGEEGGAFSRLASGIESRLVSWGGGGDEGELSELSGYRGPPAAVCNALFASHALARWAWRTWEFAVALVLIRLYPGSLRLISAYGLLDNLVRVVGGAPVGAFIDRSERLRGATTMYLLQNACILASAAAAGTLLWLAGSSDDPLAAVGPAVYWPLVTVAIAVGCTSSVGSMGAAAAVEREWVKALCGPDTLMLARMNSVMRAIDMLCLMLSPMAAGFLMTYAGMLPAVLAIAAYALVVWAPECLLLRVAHRLSPKLREPKAAPRAEAPRQRPRVPFAALCSGWGVYLRQATLLPALALALLYLTCLSLGFLMTAFLTFNGMSEAALSVFRGIAAASGLLSTAIFPRLHRAAGLTAAGAVGFAWLNACLIAGTAPTVAAAILGNPLSSLSAAAAATGDHAAGGPAAAPGSAAAAGGAASGGDKFGLASSPLLALLMSGLALSRLGIWLADLAVSQMQQEFVADEEIGTVNGVQSSMQSLFEIFSFVAGSILSRPDQFHWLMLGSLVSISTAGILYACYALGLGPGGSGGASGWGRRQPYQQLSEVGAAVDGGGGGRDGGGAENGVGSA